ncbi:peptidoglycan-binding protein [Actinoplanes sp. LDG1-06]|uniref:Peptidoglycan-binding protein n=1 Tax=Paractinoplanes ovalisporus TaxID=2810368 RepID=A0ABS2ALW9_9ACTN|nr:peptidoglycan-binding protein [Actinoplanes ovalisporus]MBM2620864.1 peptidoglycan-binding protein [Actinoplanes ovalisporus]
MFKPALRLLIGAAVLVAGVAVPAGASWANPGIRYIGPSSHYANPPDGVRCVQEVVGLAQDGQFGDQTYAAVRNWQAAKTMMADGIVGPDTGDQMIMALPESRRFFCARFMPTTFFLMDDSGNTPEGGVVTSSTRPDDAGEAVELGQPVGKCLIKNLVSQFGGAGRVFKVVWKRRLPSREEWLAAPNPVVLGGKVLWCSLMG